MANTIATAIGSDSSRDKSETRLGSVSSTGKAATYRTFAEAFVRKDGSGYVEVKRDGKVIHIFEFDAE